MKIMIMGAGALGCYFGGRLQAAGHDVTYVARGAHLEAMQANGLRIESLAGDLTLPEVRAVGHPSDAPTPDLVLFTVKNYGVDIAAQAVAPFLGPETFVVTAQNGVTAPDRLAAVIGEERIIPGVVLMPAHLCAPGVVYHAADFHEFIVGERGGGVSDRLRGFVDALNAAGVTGTISADITGSLWEKFVLISGMAALTTVTRLNMGPIRDTPDTRELLIASLEETATVGKAVYPALSDDAFEKARAFLLEKAPSEVHASMLDDLNRGSRIELEYLSGDIVRLGKAHGVQTPVHGFVYAALAPYLNGPPG